MGFGAPWRVASSHPSASCCAPAAWLARVFVQMKHGGGGDGVFRRRGGLTASVPGRHPSFWYHLGIKVSIPARKVYCSCRDRAAKWCLYLAVGLLATKMCTGEPVGRGCPDSTCPPPLITTLPLITTPDATAFPTLRSALTVTPSSLPLVVRAFRRQSMNCCFSGGPEISTPVFLAPVWSVAPRSLFTYIRPLTRALEMSPASASPSGSLPYVSIMMRWKAGYEYPAIQALPINLCCSIDSLRQPTCSPNFSRAKASSCVFVLASCASPIASPEFLSAFAARTWTLAASALAWAAESLAVPASCSAADILSDSCSLSRASTSETLPSANVSTRMPPTIMSRPIAAAGAYHFFLSSLVSSLSSSLNLRSPHRLMMMNVSGASKAQPKATAYPAYLTSLNQPALDNSSATRRASTTPADPFKAIMERRERDTERLRVVLYLLALVLVCEAVYVFAFMKV